MTGDQFDAQGEAHEALSTAVTSYGARVLSDPRILGNLVTDLLPDSPRERSLLVTAAEAGVASELQQHVDQQHLTVDTAVSMVARKLTDSRSIDMSASTWVTTEYAQALGYPAQHQAAPPAAQLGEDEDPHSATLRRPRHTGSTPPPGDSPFPPAPAPGTPSQPQPQPTVWSPAPAGSAPSPWTPQGSNPLQSPAAPGFPPAQPAAYQPTSTYQPGTATQPPGYGGPSAPPSPGYPSPAGGYQPPSNPYQASSSPQAPFQAATTPGGFQQPSPYAPGGTPAWGAAQPPRKSRKGLLFGGIGGAVVLIGVILAVVLSSSSTHNVAASSSQPPTSTATPAASATSASPSASPTASAKYTLQAGTTTLTHLLPADIVDTSTECSDFTDLPFTAYGLVAAYKCNDPGLPGGVVYAFQSNNASNYALTWKSFNKWWGLDTSSSSVDTTCPPTGTHKQGLVSWSGDVYPEHSGQVLECEEVPVDNSSSTMQPTYVWSYPTEFGFIDAQGGSSETYAELDKWWGDEAQ